MKTVHKCQKDLSGMKKRQCDFCDKSFEYLSDLKAHTLSFHERLQNYICEFCKNETKQSNLKKLMKS